MKSVLRRRGSFLALAKLHHIIFIWKTFTLLRSIQRGGAVRCDSSSSFNFSRDENNVNIEVFVSHMMIFAKRKNGEKATQATIDYCDNYVRHLSGSSQLHTFVAVNVTVVFFLFVSFQPFLEPEHTEMSSAWEHSSQFWDGNFVVELNFRCACVWCRRKR